VNPFVGPHIEPDQDDPPRRPKLGCDIAGMKPTVAAPANLAHGAHEKMVDPMQANLPDISPLLRNGRILRNLEALKFRAPIVDFPPACVAGV